MRILLCLFFSLAGHSAVASDYFLESLIVKEGERYTLPENQNIVTIAQLRLEDNAVLVIPAGLEYVVLRSKDVKVGQGVKMISKALDGVAGNNGTSAPSFADNCVKPSDGADGADGGQGQSATDVSLHWHLRSFGSLDVELIGGAAGAGGAGGNGQNADQDDACKLVAGGAAGDGGRAGKSGDGGDVVLSFSADNQELVVQARRRSKVKNMAGRVAKGGSAGKPGKGSAGRYIARKTLTSNRSWVAGGAKGKAGSEGAAGIAGNKGSFVFQFEGTQHRGPSLASATESDSQTQLQKLAQKVVELEQRIKALESQ